MDHGLVQRKETEGLRGSSGLTLDGTGYLRFGLHERYLIVPNFKVLGQPMTSEVRSNTRRGPSEMTIFGML